MNNLLVKIKNRTTLLLFLIVVFACFIRFYHLSRVPVSLYWDEVSTGYNAYSIGVNLKDEYGTFLPILFRGFNDYKMPLNIYLTAASVKVFGLNEFGVRFVSALFGTLTVFLSFFLVKQLLGVGRGKKKMEKCEVIALLASFLLGISPWHIQFSRAGFEANIALFFVILAVYLFLKGLSSYKYLLCSMLAFSLSLYSYRSAFVFVPPFLFGLIFLFREQLLKLGKTKLIFCFVILLLLIMPIAIPLTHEGSKRLEQTSIANKVEEEALQSFQKGNPVNQKLLYAKIFIEDYVAEFNPQFLFISGDPEARHGPRGMGLLYIWEIPFLLVGFFFLWKKYSLTTFLVICLWVLCSPLAASLSIPVPHALRLLNLLPIPQIVVSIGVIYIGSLVSKKMRIAYTAFLFLIISYFFVNYVRLYNITNTKLAVANWGDGYKQLVTYIESKKNQYDRIVISGHYWQPYIYFLFYEKFDPITFQKNGNAERFDKYIFGGTSWDLAVGRPELDAANLKELTGGNKSLIALSPEEYKKQEPNLKFLANITDHSGKTVFIVGELK